MPDEAAEPANAGTAVPPGVRAQLLATEHWSLLASRSTTQGEVLNRISMFLTLTSAGLVSLALAGQATRFNGVFPGFALTVLGIIFVIGFLTQVRVLNVSMEDLSFVLAMNRLRAAYVDLDPGVAPYLMASRFDDRAGSVQTYYFLGRRGSSQVAGSSMVFIIAVNAALLGLFLAGIVALAWGSPGWAVGTGIVGGAGYFAVSLWIGARRYYRFWKSYSPQFPSQGIGSSTERMP
ncbi:MAG: hypothetical protein ABI255_05740 [Microbacteriaceae bacterium]